MTKKPKLLSNTAADTPAAEVTRMPKGEAPDSMQQSRVIAQQVSYEGPIPHPVLFKQFGEVLATAPERLLHDFEKNSETNRQIALLSIKGQIRHDARAHWIVFALMIIGLGAALGAAYLGFLTLSYIVAGVLLVAVLGNYLKPKLLAKPQEMPAPKPKRKTPQGK